MALIRVAEAKKVPLEEVLVRVRTQSFSIRNISIQYRSNKPMLVMKSYLIHLISVR